MALAASSCGGSGSGGERRTGDQPSGAAQGTAGAGGCRTVEQPTAKSDGGQERPRRRLDPDRTYRATVRTNCGDFTIELDVQSAPRTAASFVSLARAGFYDGTVFHRIVPGFVIQGGDPTGTGTGGPGYKTVDRPPAGASYKRGVVAMAKQADEPAGTAGSQFFVVTGADTGLPPQYAVLGRVTDGLDVVERIGKLGDPASGQAGTPTEPVVIEAVEVTGA